jgi:hypothetical protein
LLGGNTHVESLDFGVEVLTTGGGVAKIAPQVELIDSSFNVHNKVLTMTLPASSGTTFGAFVKLDYDVIGIRCVGLGITATAGGIAATGFRVGITTATGTTYALPLTVPNGAPVRRLLPRFSPPEVEVSTLQYSATRATASSVLLSNVSQVMSKEGTVSAARMPTSVPYAFNPTLWAGFSKVHPKDRYFGALENGLYCYTLPDTHSEEFLDSVGSSPTYADPIGIVDLRSFGYVYAIICSDLDDTAGTSLAVTLNRHLEFRTSSRLFPTNFAKYTLEQYHTAQMALAQLGCFTENPVHVAAIARMVAQAARVAWPYVRPYAISAARLAGQAAVGYLGNKLGDMTQKAMVKPPAPQKQKKVKITKKAKARGKR